MWLPFYVKRKTLLITGGIVLFLVVVHAALPFVLHHYVVRTLNNIPDYRAEVRRVYVNLFRGAYRLVDVKLENVSGAVPVPLFAADSVDLSVQWGELFHGAVVGEIELDRPTLNFVNGPTPETAQTSVDKSWMDRVKELFPLKINKFTIKDGEIHFRDFSRTPNVDLVMTHTEAVAVNLTNSRRLSESLVAVIDAEGWIPENGRFKLHLEADPFALKPTFVLAAEMTNVDLTHWNDFLQAYGGVEAARGEFNVFTEIEVAEGRLNGYIKPILRDVEVAVWKQAKENPLKAIWSAIVAGLAELLKNQPEDQIATRIPLSGDVTNPDAGIIAVIGELLRNAYIEALFPSLEGHLGRRSSARQPPE